jgi:hypothetical protein
MKLEKFIKYLDYSTNLEIWENLGTKENTCWEITFSGRKHDLPYKYLDAKLIQPKDNDWEEAVYPYLSKENNEIILSVTLDPEYYYNKEGN